MAIRSGRFIGDPGGTVPIISGHEGTYRIFNSGAAEFEVFESGSLLVNVPIECSVDIRPAGDIDIRAVSAFEGIYDFLSAHRQIRSGRINTTTDLTIVNEAKDGVFYRIMNSGHRAFAVHRSNVKVLDLKPKMTIDVELRDDSLSISPTGKAEGIYYHLDQFADVKSGRFSIDPDAPLSTPLDPSVEHPIVNTVRNSKFESFYRIFNSGEHDFKLLGIATIDPEIKPGQSFDFRIEKSKEEIRVVGLNADDAIEGIYDLVGEHDG